MSNTPEKVESICVPLDPDDCGSVISGFVRFPEIDSYIHGAKEQYISFSANISLSDCQRVIGWCFSTDEGYNLEKMDRAIAAMMEMRKFMSEAENQRKRLQVKVDAYNKVAKAAKESK